MIGQFKKIHQKYTKNTPKIHQKYIKNTSKNKPKNVPFKMPQTVKFLLLEDSYILEWLAIPANNLPNKYATMKALTEYLREQDVSPISRSIDGVRSRVKTLQAKPTRGMKIKI